VAKIEEIPAMWGWMHVNEAGKLIIYKEAPKLTPIAISKSFLACILKRASCKDGWVTQESISDKIAEAKQLGLVERDNQNKRIIENHQTLATEVKEFEETTGIKLSNQRWGVTGKKLGEWVNFFLSGGVEDVKKQMTYIKNYHSQIGKKIEEFNSLQD
jgi:hypothetical protein